jgi:hypothetical protein
VNALPGAPLVGWIVATGFRVDLGEMVFADGNVGLGGKDAADPIVVPLARADLLEVEGGRRDAAGGPAGATEEALDAVAGGPADVVGAGAEAGVEVEGAATGCCPFQRLTPAPRIAARMVDIPAIIAMRIPSLIFFFFDTLDFVRCPCPL